MDSPSRVHSAESLSLSFGVGRQPEKNCRFARFRCREKFAESNFNLGATAEIRFDIRRRNVRNESTNYPAKLATPRISPSPSIARLLSLSLSLSLSRRASPDYSVNDTIRRIISVRILWFLPSGELDLAVSLALTISPHSRKNAFDSLSGLPPLPAHRSFWPSSRYADLVIDACFMLDRVRR